MKREIIAGIVSGTAVAVLMLVFTSFESKLKENEVKAIADKLIFDGKLSKSLITAMKTDSHFKGIDGTDGIDGIDGGKGKDGFDLAKVKQSEIRVIATNGSTESATMGPHYYCAVTGIEFNFVQTGGNKVCKVETQKIGERHWIVKAVSEQNQTLVCTVRCF